MKISDFVQTEQTFANFGETVGIFDGRSTKLAEFSQAFLAIAVQLTHAY